MVSNPIVEKVGGSVTSSSTTQATCITFTPASPDDVAYHCVASVDGFRTDAGDQAGGYLVAAAYKKTAGGGLVQVGTVEDCHTPIEDDADWDVHMDTSGGAIRVRVTGGSGQTVDWGGVLTITITRA